MYCVRVSPYILLADTGSCTNRDLRLCLGAFRTSEEMVYVDTHEPSLGAKRAKLPLQYASKIKSLPKHPTHDALFDKKYMKLFGARPIAICTFALFYLTLIFLTFWKYFMLYFTTLVYQTMEYCAGSDASLYQQLFMEVRDKYRYNIPVNTDGSQCGN